MNLGKEHLDLEESINCQRDSVTLTAVAPENKLIDRYCGQMGTIQKEIKSNSNDVIIVFNQGFIN